ncbi:MAG: GNAT family N-acetyltransferase [Pseudonocardia sp.]|nr:GNAT family N-acetyltransferase [Pseudonocardia sp.]
MTPAVTPVDAAGPTGIALRTSTADDLRAIALLDGRAFHWTLPEEDLELFRRGSFDPANFLLAHDGDELVGATGAYDFTVRMPGGGALPAKGVTWVSVAATHRRRGILRALMRAQQERMLADGLAVSLLTASEAGIYGRFGYGPATVRHSVRIDRAGASFRTHVPDPGGVRYVETDELRALAPALHARWHAVTPGALDRTDGWWDRILADRPEHRDGDSQLYHLVHGDGYVTYRIASRDNGRICRITDMATAGRDAYVALWRVLLGLDLIGTVTAEVAPDDPLPHLLTDPRRIRTDGRHDGMWARILDVPAALSARTYGTELDVVLDVEDPFLGRGGRFRLRGGPDGATCEPVTDAPQVRLGTSALGSLLFGGHRASSLGRVALVEATDPAVLRRVDVAFTAEREPEFGTDF